MADIHSITAKLANPSGSTHLRGTGRIYRVTAVDQAGTRHKLRVLAANHAEIHQQVSASIGEPTFLSCCYDPAATAAAMPPSPAPRIPRATAVPQVSLTNVRQGPPSAFGRPTDLDDRCSQIDSELEQAEQRHSIPGRRVAMGWLIAAAAVGLIIWTAAAIGVGALSTRWTSVPADTHSLAAPAGTTTH